MSKKWITGYDAKTGDLCVWPESAASEESVPPICKVSPPDNTTEQDKANAALIAAAPEMRNVLLEVHAMLRKPQFPTEREMDIMQSRIGSIMNDDILNA